VAIGRGQCVVDDDGLVVPISKCSIKELRAEAEARGTDAAGMKRPELTQVIKVRPGLHQAAALCCTHCRSR
jgi:hypothetical protein